MFDNVTSNSDLLTVFTNFNAERILEIVRDMHITF